MRHALRLTGALILATTGGFLFAQEPSNVPQHVLDLWTYSIGDWDVEGRIRSTPVAGSASFEWAEGRHCYIGRQVWNVGENGRSVHLTLIGGWDAVAEETVEQGFSSSGSAGTVHYRFPVGTTNMIEGSIDGSELSGRRWSGAVKVQRKGPDEFHVTTTVDDQTVHALKYVRRKGDGGARAEGTSAQQIQSPLQIPVKQQPTTERKKTSFNPSPLDNEWTRWIVGEWVGPGESDAGSGRGSARIELGLNGQFLIFKGEAEVTSISVEQRQYLKTQLHATDEEIERFQAAPFQGLEIYTLDQETGEVVGYVFDSLRCMATGRGVCEGNAQTIHWQWASGHTSTRVTERMSDDKLMAVERIAMPDGSTMEEKVEMVRRK